MEIVGTAKVPLCVCVQWAVPWTALGWSVSVSQFYTAWFKDTVTI